MKTLFYYNLSKIHI